MKNPDVNALAPGGWCRCSGQGNYGCDSSCDAPRQLVYEFTREPELSWAMPRPTFDAFDCMGGSGKVRFDLVSSDEAGRLYAEGGPYSVLGCQGLPISYLYVARWNNPETGQLEDAGYIALLCNHVALAGNDWRKTQHLVLSWLRAPSGGGNWCDSGDATAWHQPQPLPTPGSLPCPAMGLPFLQYESPLKLSEHEAIYARVPCTKSGDIVFQAMREVGWNGWWSGFATDRIVAATEDGTDGTAGNTDYYTKLQKLSIQKFCHCSEIMEDEFIHTTSGGAKYGVPSGVRLTLGGLCDITSQTSYGSYRVWHYSALNGVPFDLSLTEPTTSRPVSFGYTTSTPFQLDAAYHTCSGTTTYQIPVAASVTLHACSDANMFVGRYQDWTQSSCRYATGGVGFEMGLEFIFGQDSGCAHDRLWYVEGLPPKLGMGPHALCNSAVLTGQKLYSHHNNVTATLELDPS